MRWRVKVECWGNAGFLRRPEFVCSVRFAGRRRRLFYGSADSKVAAYSPTSLSTASRGLVGGFGNAADDGRADDQAVGDGRQELYMLRLADAKADADRQVRLRTAASRRYRPAPAAARCARR